MRFQVFHSAEEWAARFRGSARPCVVTVGNFDGLHLGHQRLLRGVVEQARARHWLAAALTFDPHPLKVLRPAHAPALIATLEQRIARLRQFGLDAVLLMKFDATLARVSPQEFVRLILVQSLGVRRMHVGANFRFGHRHAGDVTLLRKLAGELGFEVEIVPPVVIRGVVVASTTIREAVRQGRVDFAARLLGHPFALTGEVRAGSGVGRRLLVPTLNLAPQQELLPASGVYVTETLAGAREFPSVTNVGVRPTFNGKGLTIETHLLEPPRQLSPGGIEVRFLKRLRDEKKFGSAAALRGQIERDIARARAFFKRTRRRQRTK